ncbi:protein LURP-one-related 10-like isoform X1 [Phaseolus vulgaris]|uniref:protein LURP-one-related 10-like isoform X1 n=1 Tax=Phaseolus vulgaris TaxID=3885 RepID=UPI0035CB74B1
MDTIHCNNSVNISQWFRRLLHQSYTAQNTVSPSPMENPFQVINSSYCAPYTINLQINTEKGATYDANGRLRFYIKRPLLTVHDRRVLYDDAGKPILTLYKKIMTMHRRCQVFRGQSSDSSELLFSVKKSEILQSGVIKLDVFLANNKKESVRDFRVNISSDKSSCTVFAGESPTVVATMVNNRGFDVLVNPFVDYAFIVALLMIINDIKFYYNEVLNSIAKITPLLVSIMIAAP